VKPNAFTPRKRNDFLHLGRIEDRSLLTAHGCFKRNDRHTGRNSPGSGLVEDLLDFVGGEGSAAWRQWNERDVAKRLYAVAGVQIKMALGLDDGPARPPSQRPNREVVRERARRHEHRSFLAKNAGELFLQLVDHAVEDIRVGNNALFLRQVRQQM